eukprot:PhF_6_TR5091/c0_g1_i1/m.7142
MAYSKPHHWYFTTKDLVIKRKMKLSLNSKVIEDHFVAACHSSSGVVAQQLCINPESPETGYLTTTFITQPELRNFLHEDKGNGILQLFLDPKAETKYNVYNSVLNATWTPNLLIIEKVTNKNKLDDSRIAVNDRCVVFEHSRCTTTTPVVSSRISTLLEDICKSIAAHVEILHRYRITSMNLTFKMDANDTPWLLWCNSLRIIDVESPARNLTFSVLAPSRDVVDSILLPKLAGIQDTPKLVTKVRKVTKTVVERKVPCRLCQMEVPQDGISLVPQCNITFPLGVLEFYSNHPDGDVYCEDDVMNSSSQDKVPAHILLLHPYISLEEYVVRRRVNSWKKQMISLCHDCVQSLLQLTASIHVSENGTIQNPFGKKAKRVVRSAKQKPVDRPEVAVRATSSIGLLPPIPGHREMPYDAGGLPEEWEMESAASNAADLYMFQRGVAFKATSRRVVPKAASRLPMYKPPAQKHVDLDQVSSKLQRLLALTQEEILSPRALDGRSPRSNATTPVGTPREFQKQ